ncbi:hypothetical protein CPC08DRAFT_594871, partial [Agrocybe pediades]
ADEQRDWDREDGKALGAIRLCLADQIDTHMKGTSAETWNEIQSVYGQENAATVFGYFKRAINTKIPTSGDPRPAIETIANHLQAVVSANISLPQSLQAMILLGLLPPRYDSVASIILQNNSLSNLSFAIVRDAVFSENDRHTSMPGNRPQAANRISSVKRKGKDPQHKQQNDQSNQSKQEPKRGKRSGKKFKEPRGHAHSHFASAGLLGPTIALQPSPPAPTTATVASITPGGITQRKVSTSKPAAVATSEKSVYPTVNASRTLAERLGVPKTARYLKPLEDLVSKNASSSSSEERAPKRARVESDDEDAVSLGSEEDNNYEFESDHEMDENDVDMEIADAAGLDTGFYDETRQVPLLEHVREMANYLNIHDHYATCSRCKGKKRLDPIVDDWIMDSGASAHFTFNLDDFSEYKEIKDAPIVK